MLSFAEHLELLDCSSAYIQSSSKLYPLSKILNRGKEPSTAPYCIVYHNGDFTVQQASPEIPLGQISFVEHKDALLALSQMTEQELESLL